MYTKYILFASTLVMLYVLHVQATDMMGGSGPIIIKTSGRKNRNQDLVMIGGRTKCGHGPTIVKTGGQKRRHGSDIILLGGQNHCHHKEVEKKTEYVPVPHIVKEQVHVPVPYKETVHVPVHVPVPVHIPVHIPMKEEESYGSYGGQMDFGGMGGYGGGYGGGMEWRRR